MSTQKHFLMQAWAIFGPLKRRMAWILMLMALGQVLALVGPYIQGTIIDNISQGKAMSQTYWLIALAGAVMLLGNVFSYGRERYEVRKVDFDIEEAASDQTMSRMLALSVGQHNMLHSGLKHSIINRGQHSLTSLVNMLVYEIVPTFLRVAIISVAMCWLIMTMGLIVLVAMVSFTGLTLWINHTFGSNLKKLERMASPV